MRDQILSEATRLFAARGFDATPIQEIADAVGIRKPSLLYHFPSKEALRISVLDLIVAHWNEALPRLLHAARSGEGQFDNVVEELVAFFRADPDRARLILREFLDRPAEASTRLGAPLRSWVAIVAESIRKGQSKGRVPADVDPEAYVVHVINLVVAGMATYEALGDLVTTEGTPQERSERHVRELLRVAKRGLFIPVSVQ